jgi:hypothetical protein
VAKAQTMNTGLKFRRNEMVHGYALSCAGLSPAICMIARFTAVFVICTL